MFIVYTEIHKNDGFERWFYGQYEDENRANEVAISLGHNPSEGIYHCVCDASDAKAFGIQNLPKEV